MPDIYGSHFEFGGVSSRQYGLILAGVDGDRFLNLHGEIEGNTMFLKTAKKNFLISDDYSGSPVEFELDIVFEEDKPIMQADRREIEKWLFGSRRYRKLYLDAADDPFMETGEYINGELKRLYLNCRFMEPEKIEGFGNVFGYHVKVECDSPFMWQDPVTYTWYGDTTQQTSADFVIDVDSDLDDYIYPQVTVRTGGTAGGLGGFIFTAYNATDDATRLTEITDINAQTNVVMDGEVNYISNDYFLKFNHPNFIRLLDGKNVIHITGTLEYVRFTFSQRRLF